VEAQNLNDEARASDEQPIPTALNAEPKSVLFSWNSSKAAGVGMQ